MDPCGIAVVLAAAFWIAAPTAQQTTERALAFDGSDRLVEVASGNRQWTGVAVSSKGRVFVNFPRWQPDVPVSVGELDPAGNVVPYPDEETNRWGEGEDPARRFVCVQSVYVDRANRLWILDPANPMFRGVIDGGPKLMQVNLVTNDVEVTHVFADSIAPQSSYLNDVRVDTRSGTAFITDSGLGAIVAVDLETGSARRLLEDHPSTKAEDTTINIGGKPVPLVVHSDGIALDQDGGWLYYQALTGWTMYRVPLAALRDDRLTPQELADRVEPFAQSGVADGLIYGPGGVYVTSLEDGAIKVVDNDGRVMSLVKDPRISWPDSFALGLDENLWFTTSQIHLGPRPESPYRLFKIALQPR